MSKLVIERLQQEIDQIKAASLYKAERIIESPQGGTVQVNNLRVINMCANNYLGLADDPAVIAAAHEALDRWGYGMASVRFICGTQTPHKLLESRLSGFLGSEDTILYSSCFDANGGLFEVLLGPEDAVISDELNHASIIDGIRLCKAQRFRYRNSDMDDLESKLKETSGARVRLIATDGVFSMDGYIAELPEICDLADRYDALVMVDDSHAVGVLGANGRGSHEHHGVMHRIDVLTGTLGKALGGASGGYVSGRREIVEMLRQRSRPYLFSNTVAPVLVGASLAILDLLEKSTDLRDRLEVNTKYFRSRIAKTGYEVLSGEHPIVPLMIGDAARAKWLADALLDRGVYVTAFSYPVVPKDKARIRVQISAAHTNYDLDRALDAFGQVRTL